MRRKRGKALPRLAGMFWVSVNIRGRHAVWGLEGWWMWIGPSVAVKRSGHGYELPLAQCHDDLHMGCHRGR